MALKKIGGTDSSETTETQGESKKQEFTKVTGRKTLVTPRENRVKKGNDPSAAIIKLCLFGEYGTGKTFSIVGMLQRGLKVLVISTDLGGSGLNTVRLYLNRIGQSELLENLREVELRGYDEIQDFMDEPAAFFPDIYEFDPDILFWDGFSSFQFGDLGEEVGKNPIERSGELPGHIESGLFFEQGQWGMVTNGTIRILRRFFSLNNKKTGKLWSKVVTMLEKIKSKGNKEGGFIELKEPLLQGAGGTLSGAAFDLIIRCDVKQVMEGSTLKEVYQYQIKGENKKTKNRGYELPLVLSGDMYELWGTLEKQLGINRTTFDEKKVQPILLGENTNA